MTILRVTVGEVVAEVQVKDAAPLSAKQILAALPIEVPLVHASRSGNCAVAHSSEFRNETVPIEGQVSMYYPDMVAYDPMRGYLVFAYGQAQARSSTGTHWVTHFGTVINGSEVFARALQDTRDIGESKMRIELGD